MISNDIQKSNDDPLCFSIISDFFSLHFFVVCFGKQNLYYKYAKKGYFNSLKLIGSLGEI